MKSRKEIDLSTILGTCHVTAVDASPNVGHQITPSHWKKVYRGQPTTLYYFRPTNWKFSVDLRPVSEITKQVDKRTLLELMEQRTDFIHEVSKRAVIGNPHAIDLLVSTARGLIHILEDLEKRQPPKLRASAETHTDWPVLLSTNPQDVRRAKERISELKVGSRATTKRHRAQRLDPRSIWSKLADEAIEACGNNKSIVPLLLEHCSGSTRHRTSFQLWGKKVEITRYFLSKSNCIVIADWEQKCVKLSQPITAANLQQWWEAVKFCVLEKWAHNIKDYDAALKKIGQPDEEDYVRRNLAVDSVEQAFRSLVGIRVQ